MSLEAKLAELKIDDVPSIVDAVKKDGVEKSGLAANVDVLAARCASEDEAEAFAGLKVAKTLAEECPEAQAFYKECLTACMLLELRTTSRDESWSNIAESVVAAILTICFYLFIEQVWSRLFRRAVTYGRPRKRPPSPFAGRSTRSR